MWLLKCLERSPKLRFLANKRASMRVQVDLYTASHAHSHTHNIIERAITYILIKIFTAPILLTQNSTWNHVIAATFP